MSQETIEGFRLSPGQRRLWTLERSAAALVTQGVFSIEGAIDEESFESAFQRVVVRHEALATRFARLPGMELPVQVIDEQPLVTLRTTEGDASTLDAQVQLELNTPFDVEHGPVLRAVLVRMGPETQALVVSASSLAMDRYSLDVWVGELAQAVAGTLEEGEDLVQFIQFSEWLNEMAESEDAAEGSEFWQGQEALGDAELRLPGAPATPDRAQETGTVLPTVRRQSSAELAERVARCAESLEVREPVILLAAWQAVVAASTSASEVHMGFHLDGRRYEELQRAVGLFERFVPLAVPLRLQAPWRNLVQATARAIEDVELWQDVYPSGDEPRSLGFSFREATESPQGSPWTWRRIDGHDESDAFELRLDVSRLPEGGFDLRLYHDPAIYSKDRAEQWLERFVQLLQGAVDDPRMAMDRLPLIGPEEMESLDALAAGPELPKPKAPWLPALLEQQAEDAPDRVAVVAPDGESTFAELTAGAHRLARRLLAGGLGAEDRVVLLLERSTVLLEALWGVLAAGGAFVPVDPQLPTGRLQAIIEDVKPRYILHHGAPRHDREALAGDGVEFIDLDTEAEGIAALPSERPEVPESCERLAYVLFTSGSTGRPQGIGVTHRSMAHLHAALDAVFSSHAEAWDRRTPQCIGVNAPLSFDASIKQVVQLLSGHTLVLVPDAVRADGDAYVRFLEEQRIQAVDTTPLQLQLLLDSGLGTAAPDLRCLLVGGEAIAPELWDRLVADGQRVYLNVYGPTECTVDTTAVRVVARAGGPTLGGPIGNVRVHIMGAGLERLPSGDSGELVIGGEGVARGYFGRPAATAEKFVPDSLAGTPGARLYRSGDRARWAEDGRLEILGRIDRQVKIRGYRIELGEIEARLERHGDVRQAAVIRREDHPGDPRLVGYWVPRIRRRVAEGDYTRRELPNGLWVAQQNDNETDYLYHEIFENRCYVQHGVQLPEDACVLDVGANIGMFSLFVSQFCPSARIYAFEPLEPIRRILRQNLQLCAADVELFDFGLASEEREETFLYYPRYSMMSGAADLARPEEEVEVVKRFLENEAKEGKSGAADLLDNADEVLAGRFVGQRETCRLRRLSEVLREQAIGQIDLLKIDVQRAEMEVLGGLENDDWARIDQVVMEVHDSDGDVTSGQVEALLELLEGRGYRVVVEQDPFLVGTDRYNLYAVRPTARPGVDLDDGGPTANTMASGEELRAYLHEHLSDYMVPNALVELPALPITGRGKLDVDALPSPGDVDLGPVDVKAPRTPFEAVLVEIWSDLLGIETVGIDGDFFALGGHSLLATRLAARVRETFHVEMPLRVLFAHPILEAQAKSIEGLMQNPQVADVPPIVPLGEDAEIPLSFSQERLWFLDRLYPDDASYNCPHPLRIEGPLDLEVLSQAFAWVVERHSILRTRYPAVGGRPQAVVDRVRDEPTPLPYTDLRSLEAGDQQQDLVRRLAAETLRPFDLGQGPLWRVEVLQLEDEVFALLFSMHHIITDARSLEILVSEIGSVYAALLAGDSPERPDLEVQYGDFAAWQRTWLSGEVLESHLEYWRERLAGAPPILELPTDRPRIAASSTAHRIGFQIPAATAEGIRQLGQGRRVTLFMTMLAVYQMLLGRWAATEDVVVGSPVSGRRDRALEDLIGFFLETVVLRLRFADDPSFGDLVERSRESVLGAHAHQDLPFDRLVEALGASRDLRMTPIFQVLFVLLHAPRERQEVGPLGITALGSEAEVAKHDLGLYFVESEGRLAGSLAYRADLFDAVTMERFVSHFQTLLGSLLEAPERPLSSHSLLTPAEREQVTSLGAAEDGAAEDVVEAFLRHAAADLEATVIEWWGADDPAPTVWSRGDLLSLARGLAERLEAHGVGPETPVALVMDRSPRMVMALLAVLLRGGTYVPFEITHPTQRLRQSIEACGAVVLVGEEGVSQRFEGVSCPILELEVDGGRAAPPDAPTTADVDPSVAAYVIHTSGSTGSPKGVVVERRHLARYTASILERLDLDDASGPVRFAMVTTLAADLGHTAVFPALASGGSLTLMPPESVLDPHRLATILSHGPVDVLKIVPSHLRSLLAVAPEEAGLIPRQRLVLGGAALDHGLVAQVRALAPACRILNHYGPTETTVGVTVHPVESAEDTAALARAPVPLGQPLEGVTAWVVDRRLEPVPDGFLGELVIGGATVSRGYLGRPRETAQRFVPDPWSTHSGARLYRTGDRVRRLGVPETASARGDLVFEGRFGHQVKSRGHRIELEEIESVLQGHPGVRAAAVSARGPVSEAQLVAHWVSGEEAAPTVTDLRRYLGERLPEPMIPAHFVRVEALPIGANGKLDRAALSRGLEVSPDHPRSQESLASAPASIHEARLVKVFEELLGCQGVQADSNFFELGGHSLLALELMARLETAFDVEIPLVQFFQDPTARGLAQHWKRQSPRSTGPLVEMQQGSGGPPLYLFHAAYGDVVCYLELVQHLGPEVPVMGLEVLGDVDTPPLDRVEAMAEAYASAICEHRPEGPYRFAGLSFGGILAFETARVLDSRGREVEWVALIDSAIEAKEDAPDFADFLADALGRPAEELRTRTEEELLTVVEAAIEEHRDSEGLSLAAADRATLERVFRVRRASWDAARSYAPSLFGGRVVLFRSIEGLERSGDRSRGWEAFAPSLEVVEVSGPHTQLLDPPYVEGLAAALRTIIFSSGEA